MKMFKNKMFKNIICYFYTSCQTLQDCTFELGLCCHNALNKTITKLSHLERKTFKIKSFLMIPGPGLLNCPTGDL